ncbi:DUF3302 domain-containing protein [Phreatobacter stygius]|uniref:DUF3302 domain-containing protein n=1 Tax=Phreatobacter stygius TaxID=1940610 RepID=A0A4D7BCA6_9HYPH|nr:DUF3302 domain-containing protein [Phreatobacter stygius]
MSTFDIFAIIVLGFVVASGVALVVVVGALPGWVAHKRRHPYAQAVTIAGWVTLICGFVLWPVAMIWAYVDIPARTDLSSRASPAGHPADAGPAPRLGEAGQRSSSCSTSTSSCCSSW